MNDITDTLIDRDTGGLVVGAMSGAMASSDEEPARGAGRRVAWAAGHNW